MKKLEMPETVSMLELEVVIGGKRKYKL